MQLVDPFIVDLADPADVAAKVEIARAEQAKAQQIVDLWAARVAALETSAEPGARRRVVAADGEISWVGSHTPTTEAAPETVRELVAEQRSRSAHAVEDWALTHPDPEISDLVVEIVNAEGRQIRTLEVHEILNQHGFSFTSAQVSKAMQDAAVRAQPPRIAKGAAGAYAPLAG